MPNIPGAWEGLDGGGWLVPFAPLHPLPPQHQLSLVFVMSAGEGHHVVFLAPSPSFLP